MVSKLSYFVPSLSCLYPAVFLLRVVDPQRRDRALYRVVHDALDLQLVLVVGVPLGEVAELLGQVQAVRNVLRRDKVLGHLEKKINM